MDIEGHQKFRGHTFLSRERRRRQGHAKEKMSFSSWPKMMLSEEHLSPSQRLLKDHPPDAESNTNSCWHWSSAVMWQSLCMTCHSWCSGWSSGQVLLQHSFCRWSSQGTESLRKPPVTGRDCLICSVSSAHSVQGRLPWSLCVCLWVSGCMYVCVCGWVRE